MTGRDSGGGEKPPRRGGARKQDWITNQLRRVYDEALQEEIPADMLELLAKLEGKTAKESDS
ncbi:MAG TPA: NepR family anti-sigma factor [Amaricoccus sp.]|nr:NepR family anti-sigma factor [Amaricoccus sp.]HRO12159.1 NepR family anti-sigma factor [Amaricoccus sp.]